MSYNDRAGENANSAIIVSVTPEDFFHDVDEKNLLLELTFRENWRKKRIRLHRGKFRCSYMEIFSQTGNQLLLVR